MSGNYTSLEELSAVVAWLTNQRSDSAYSRFCLFRIDFQDPLVLGSTFGAADAMCRLNEFGAMLAATVRNTDLVARKLSEFWVLAPACDPPMLACRICELNSKIEEIGLDVVRCSVGAYVFPIRDFEVRDPRGLLDRLGSLSPQYRFDPHQDRATSDLAPNGVSAI